tara:strand:+ start:25411 stop:25752 length:342 start_codon:yes stop_codon:yes gene_type:complete
LDQDEIHLLTVEKIILPTGTDRVNYFDKEDLCSAFSTVEPSAISMNKRSARVHTFIANFCEYKIAFKNEETTGMAFIDSITNNLITDNKILTRRMEILEQELIRIYRRIKQNE